MYRRLDAYNLSELCEKTLRALRLKYIITLFAAVVFISPNSFAQLDTAIVRTYGGPYYEEGRQIIECSAGGYAVIGTTGSDQPNNTNFYLLRLDEELNCIWNKNYGGAEVEWGYSIVEDANGNFLICGYTNSFGEGGYDILVYKVDTEGSVIWEKTYGGSDWDFAYKIIAHPTEGYLICGKTYSYGNGRSDAYLLHINDDGNIINEWTYGGEGDDEFRDVLLAEDNNILLGGAFYTDENSSKQGYIKRISLNGEPLWDFWVSTPLSGVSGIVVNNGYIYYCGDWLTSENYWGCHFGVINSEETEIFYEASSFDGDLYYTSIVNHENEVALCGVTNVFGSGENNGFFYMRAFDGNFISGITIGAPKLEFYNAISSNEKYILTGSSIYGADETEQLPVMIYPDFTFSSATYTEWNQNNCFTLEINESVLQLNKQKIKSYLIHSINGQLIENVSAERLQNEYNTFSNRGHAMLVTKKGDYNLLLCIPIYAN